MNQLKKTYIYLDLFVFMQGRNYRGNLFGAVLNSRKYCGFN